MVDTFQSLSSDELIMLGALSMIDDFTSERAYATLGGPLLTSAKAKAAVHSLVSKHIYRMEYYRVGLRGISTEYVALINYEIFVVHPEWGKSLQAYLEKRFTMNSVSKLFHLFFDGNAALLDDAIQGDSGQMFFEALFYVLDHPKFKYFISKASVTFKACLVDFLVDRYESSYGSFYWDYTVRLSDEIGDSGREYTIRKGRKEEIIKERIRERVALYEYLINGNLMIELKTANVNSYTLALVAIQQLIKGNPEGAYKFFTKAFTFHNKLFEHNARMVKGVFNSDVVNYCFLLCNILVGTETAMNKNVSMEKKLDKVNGHKLLGRLVSALNTQFVTHKDFNFPSNRSVDKQFLESIVPIDIDWLLAGVLDRLGKLGGKGRPAWWNREKPQTAFVCHELQAAEDFKQEGRTLDSPLGKDSILYRLVIKEPWRENLEALLRAFNPDGEGKDLEESQKLLYFIKWDSLIPVLRKRLKNGRWSSGRELSINDFLKMTDIPDVDGYDSKLRSVADPWEYRMGLDTTLPQLIGCKRVFFVDDYDRELPVNIHQERAYVNIDKKRGGFSISANWDDDALTIHKNTDTDYSIIIPTARERQTFDILNRVNRYPAKAEPLITQLIKEAGAKIGLRTNMAVEMDNLDKVTGKSLLSLQVTPTQDGCFLMTVVCHPLPEMTVMPGKGNISSVEDFDGRKVQLERDIKTEKQNLKAIADELVELEVFDAEDDDIDQTDTWQNIRFSVKDFLDFLEWTKDNAGVCEMEWKKGTKITVHPPVKGSSVSINIKSKNGWFEMEGDVQIEEKQVISLQKLLLLMQGSKSKYVKLNDHEYLQITGKLRKILRKLDNVAVESRNHLQVAPAAVALLGDVLDSDELQVNTCQALVDLEQRIKTSEHRRPRVPKMLNAELRGYQQEGFEWMSKFTDWGAGVCLADDMGLGKTVQTITLLLEQQANGPSLIVAPASVVPNWRNELAKFAPTLLVSILNDSLDRKATIERAKAGDVVIITYAMLNIEQESLTAKEWNVVCLDEAHTIKNANTKMSKAAMRLQAQRKVMLTGTPLQNHLSELWNLFQFIDPGLLGSLENFKKKYIIPIEEDHDKERQTQLRKLIAPFLLRRTKAEVIEELPEKHDIYLPVSLSPEEMTLYEARRQKTEKSLNSAKKIDVSVLAELTKLREMACSCSLVDKRWKKESSKVQAFIELAEELQDGGNRALVFSQFTSFFDEVRKAMDKAKIPYLYLDGSTPMKKREKLVSDFQNGACPFFLISLKAGGLGLNLTGANYVIHLDPWWNPAIEQQATDRAYRIGQNQNVTVYHLISEHTIEEKILRLHKSKRDLADSLLEGMDVSTGMSKEELLKLLMK